jgi:hypothetical protein
VVIKSTIFWDRTPCSPLKVNRRFGGTYRLYLQGRRVSRARNQCEISWQAEKFRRWRRYIPPKRRLTFNGLHGVISQKTVHFIITAMRTSNHKEYRLRFYSCLLIIIVFGSVRWSIWADIKRERRQLGSFSICLTFFSYRPACYTAPNRRISEQAGSSGNDTSARSNLCRGTECLY